MKWRGADGTEYKVVASTSVGSGQPRWWLDKIPDDGDVTLGPSTPERLHLLPASSCALKPSEIRNALVRA